MSLKLFGYQVNSVDYLWLPSGVQLLQVWRGLQSETIWRCEESTGIENMEQQHNELGPREIRLSSSRFCEISKQISLLNDSVSQLFCVVLCCVSSFWVNNIINMPYYVASYHVRVITRRWVNWLS